MQGCQHVVKRTVTDLLRRGELRCKEYWTDRQKARMQRWRQNQGLVPLSDPDKGVLRSLVGASVVTQEYLSKQSKGTSPECTHCSQKVIEDVPHIIWGCPTWQPLRKENPGESEEATDRLPEAGITQIAGLLPLPPTAVPPPPVNEDTTIGDPTSLPPDDPESFAQLIAGSTLYVCNGRIILWGDGSGKNI